MMWLEIVALLVTVFMLYQLISWYYRSKKSKIDLQSQSSNILIPYSSSTTSGQRQYMEDRTLIQSKLLDEEGSSFYAVFDGHGGSNAAEFCVEHLLEYLLQDPDYKTKPIEALINAFQQLDKTFISYANSCFPAINDGTTVISVLVKDHHLYVANLGDSRAILVQSDFSIIPMSDDHKPHRADEVQRIQSLGGAVFFHNGVWRVNGVLAVSRAIGDQLLKPYISSVPDIQVKAISRMDRFVVLGSDGLFDVLSNQTIAVIIEKHTRLDPATKSDPVQQFQKLSKVLVEAAVDAGSTDNISCIVIDLTRLSSNENASSNATASSTTPDSGNEQGLASSSLKAFSSSNDLIEEANTQQYSPSASLRLRSNNSSIDLKKGENVLLVNMNRKPPSRKPPPVPT
jgi:protein phosphatase 1L